MRAILFGMIVACSGAVPRGPALIPAEDAAPLPPITYPVLDGGHFASADQAGHVVVLDVWASYCEPCRKAFPRLDELAVARPDVYVVGLSMDEHDQAVRGFLAEVPAGFPIARDPEETAVGPPLHIRKLPTLIVLDRQGRVRLRLEEGAAADYDALPALVDALRAEP